MSAWFRDSYGFTGRGMITVIALAILLVLGVGVWGGTQHGWFIDHNAEACVAAGGVVDSSTKSGLGTGVGAKGQVTTVITTTTTHFCIIDGSVTDIW